MLLLRNTVLVRCMAPCWPAAVAGCRARLCGGPAGAAALLTSRRTVGGDDAGSLPCVGACCAKVSVKALVEVTDGGLSWPGGSSQGPAAVVAGACTAAPPATAAPAAAPGPTLPEPAATPASCATPCSRVAASRNVGRRCTSPWMQSSARVARLAAVSNGHRAWPSSRFSKRCLLPSSPSFSSSMRKVHVLPSGASAAGRHRVSSSTRTMPKE
mmetsp:Transcript_48545/g.155059  ORF Transcript_48545/g.155059 Transcript_48545/m.155059 type:complete len:213 (-) Transcript_48545:862-1500(-)